MLIISLDVLKQAGFTEITIHEEIPAFLPDYGLSITFLAVKLSSGVK